MISKTIKEYTFTFTDKEYEILVEIIRLIHYIDDNFYNLPTEHDYKYDYDIPINEFKIFETRCKSFIKLCDLFISMVSINIDTNKKLLVEQINKVKDVMLSNFELFSYEYYNKDCHDVLKTSFRYDPKHYYENINKWNMIGLKSVLICCIMDCIMDNDFTPLI